MTFRLRLLPATLAAAMACLLLAACSGGGGRAMAPEPARPVDAARFYQGRWYEIARTPMKITDGCVAGTTDYYRKPDGRMHEGRLFDRDACREAAPDGKEKVFEGPVTILDPGANAKFRVGYRVWGLFTVTRTYWILDHGDSYQWFIVADPAFENVSIFTRLPRPEATEVAALTARVRALGYDPAKLEFPTTLLPGQH